MICSYWLLVKATRQSTLLSTILYLLVNVSEQLTEGTVENISNDQVMCQNGKCQWKLPTVSMDTECAAYKDTDKQTKHSAGWMGSTFRASEWLDELNDLTEY